MAPPVHDPGFLPGNLPVPLDDGACLHLRGRPLPDFGLPATTGPAASLARLHEMTHASGVVLFFYPRTGVPGQPPALGFHGEEWDSIPGARGCTPQSCGFRDLYQQFRALGVEVLGLSTNTTEHQREFKARNHVPFEFLSDAELKLTHGLKLPTFAFPVESGGPDTLVQRMAWYCEPDHTGVLRIAKVWYPVFPPDKNAATVFAWLERRTRVQVRPATDADAAFIREELLKHWGSTQIWSVGRRFDADRLAALIARVDDQYAGLVTYDANPGLYQCELVTVSSRLEGAGVASRLLEAAEFEARRTGCTRLFLTTTNDNTKAIAFYQKRGWRLAALHKGNVEEARKRKAVIPWIGHHGIPIRDELELEMWLE